MQENITESLYRWAESDGSRCFLRYGDQKLSYHHGCIEVERYLQLFLNIGLEKGSRVVVLLENSSSAVCIYLAAIRAGIIPIMFNIQMPLTEVCRYIDALDVDHILLADDFRGDDNIQLITVNAHSFLSDFLNVTLIRQDQFIPTTRSDDHASYLLTSGTTGLPKIAVHNHGNMSFTVQLLAQKFWQLEKTDVCLLAGSMSHIFGQTVCLTTIAVGASISILEVMQPKLLFETIEKYGVTFIAGVPMLAQLLLSAPNAKAYDLSSLNKMMLGGSYVSSELITALKQQLNIDAVVGYGMTEGVPVSYLNTSMMSGAPAGTVGKIAEATQVLIRGNDGQSVSSGSYGEILVKGPQIINGYLDGSSAEAFVDGWFRTGDIGMLDDNGYLFWLERKKDMFKVYGNTIFPSEIERVLMSHPGIAEAAVDGFPHNRSENLVKAYIVLKDSSLEIQQIKLFCKKNLIYYKRPRIINIVNSLPKNSAGKVDKLQLRKK